MRAIVKKLGMLILALTIICMDIQYVFATELSNTMVLNSDSLNDKANYREGWYKSWGGSYEATGGSYCSNGYYIIGDETYYFYTNDSRVIISISEFDNTGKWVKYNSGLRNGAAFTKQKNTHYIAITLKSLEWGIDILELFQNGLRIDLSSMSYSNEKEYEQYDLKSLQKIENWVSGSYSTETGEYVIKKENVCYQSYINIDDRVYIVKLPNSSMKMKILELDSKGKTVKYNDLFSGESWKKDVKTSYIALSVYSGGLTYEKFVESMTGMQFGLVPYTTFIPNGEMKDFSSFDFVEKMNVGWNLGNSLDARSTVEKRGNDANLRQELNWGNPYITKELIDYVASCGINTIRIPVTWYYNTYEDEAGTLRVGTKWLARVKEVVDYAMANDMYVIINSHHDQPILYAGVSDEEMTLVLKRANELWRDIAEYFREYDEHLIFEGFNEIDNLERSWNYGDVAASQMNQLNQTFVSTVRATGGNNTKRILMVPTLLDGTNSDILGAYKLPDDIVQDRLIVQVHTYSKRFHQVLEKNMIEIEKFSNKWRVPVVIGEWGTDNTYEQPELRAVHAANFVARAAKHGIKCIWWDNGSNYAIIDRRNFANSNKEMIEALISGYQGEAYEVQNEIVLNEGKHYVLKMPNLQTGAIEDKYWGTLTTDISGSGISVSAGKEVIVCLNAINEATDIWIQRVLFYDAEGHYISGKEIQKMDYLVTIPSDAATMRVSMNSPTRTISLEKYNKYLQQGDLELSVCIYNRDNVVPVSLIN